ncbi:Protein scd2/ral3 [Erysiphe necator]|uniref:Putative scd2 ral3 n=1 Tax=Uncinula necator TaxID=52586 RepID=A0A0B1P025_UNCNE|nr:Protein scd2/ral3 [Erysiphe necator]KHJ31982.1 putative scd2 ral3 [Erysiphe necator]
MKVLRRSLKSSDREKSTHGSMMPKSAIAIIPPKKVIRALHDYEAQSPQELSFRKGDFFHVIGKENDMDWYEACNPAVPDARGLVPVTFFQILGKTERDSALSETYPLPVRSPEQDSGYSENLPITPVSLPGTARSSRKITRGYGAMVYGIVMYDFVSERVDELDAKAGEAIIVIAQSNPEWFVAKPIGRLGGPGLIPVSFIEIRDMTTGLPVPDALEAVQRARVPRVEEWKKMAADYKNSSISLGKFDLSNLQQNLSTLEMNMNSMTQEALIAKQNESLGFASIGRNMPDSYQTRSPSLLPAPQYARIPRYCFDDNRYWFIVEVHFEDGRSFELCRFYEDFYDFQIQLLNEFPDAAGVKDGDKRTLPFMPGPVSHVTDAITQGRRNSLDKYVKDLLIQPSYISRSQMVREFFVPREGDTEISPDNLNEEYRLSDDSLQSSSDSATDGMSRISSRGNFHSSNPSGLSAAPQRSPYPTIKTESTLSVPTLQMSSMKVKIYFGDDLIAIRVPNDIQFERLVEKIRDRLKIPTGEIITLSYKDEASSERPLLLSNNDLDFALSRNDKLVIYVE